MYEAFFNLRTKPFDLVPDPDFIYLSSSHRKALTYLDYGIRERAGFILLTGEVGSGKTTLIRNLIQRKYERVVLAKVFNTRVDSQQLLAMINDDFGLQVQGKDKVTLVRELNDFLVGQFAAGNRPILIIDEAQNLGADLLEEVRMLSNLETSQQKLLQIVLVGQPELRQTLGRAELMQLRQRISINCHLKPLGREEIGQYIQHRMSVAGNANAVTFTGKTLDLVHSYSRGIPRLINIFCDFIMLTAFADGSTTVTESLVKDVIGELDFENTFWGETPSLNPQAVAKPAPAEPAAAEPHSLLQGLEQRLDRLEQAVSRQQAPSALEKLCEGFDSLKGELSAQMKRHEGELSDLRKKLESVSAASAAVAVTQTAAARAGSPGLAWRFVQGICGYGGKR